MAGSPKKRARRAAADSTGSRAGTRGKQRPVFEPARPDDFALVEAGVARAAAAAERAKSATSPAARVAALEDLGLVASGRARQDRALLAAATRVQRDTGIVAAWALGMTAPTIAAKFDLDPDHVGRVITAHRERRARVVLPSSSELLLDALEALEAQLERLTLLAAKSDAAEAARVGAIRTWREMWVSRLELMQVMGLVSVSPSSEIREQRARDLLRGLLDALRAEGVPQDVLDRVASRVLSSDTEAENVIAIEGRVR
jgi:hypothetical protein